MLCQESETLWMVEEKRQSCRAAPVPGSCPAQHLGVSHPTPPAMLHPVSKDSCTKSLGRIR